MITREEYNKALDIVEEYHKQMFIGINSLKNDKTLIEGWDKLNDCPGRLQRALNHMYNAIKDEEVIYIEDVTKKIFMKQPSVGKKAWQVFTKLRGY